MLLTLMRQPWSACAALLILYGCGAPPKPAVETPPPAAIDFTALAKRVVRTTANVQPGHYVVVYGGRHTLPLMEALAIEIQIAGGMAEMRVTTDRLVRSFLTEVPEAYLEQKPAQFVQTLKHITTWIGISSLENPQAVLTGVPQERLAKADKADAYVREALNASGVRVISIGYPTKERAQMLRVDFNLFEKMHWDAVGADYTEIAKKGQQLKTILQKAKQVRITSPAGTDFTFSPGNRPVFVDDGIVTAEKAKSKLFLDRVAALPGGLVTFAPIETSANGTVVVPRDLCRFQPITGVSFEFKNGKVENFKAAEGGQCYQQTLAPYSGPKDVLGSVSIGLNPALKVVDSPGEYRPARAAGMVWIYTGENMLLGGNNKSPGGFGFPIVQATVIVDGKTVVKDGALSL